MERCVIVLPSYLQESENDLTTVLSARGKGWGGERSTAVVTLIPEPE